MPQSCSRVSNERGNAAIGVVFFLLIAGAIAFAGTHHVVNTNDGLKLYQKDRFGFHSTYVDMTNTSIIGLRRHPELVRTMTVHGDLELMPGGRAMVEFMDQAGMAAVRVNEVVNQFDSDGEIRRNLTEASVHATDRAIEATEAGVELYRDLDERYDVTERARGAAEAGARGLNRLLAPRN